MPFRSTYRKQNGILVPYGSTGGIIDNPYSANYSALLHGDGSHGGTTFRDEVGNSWSITHGSPTISTTQSKFGGSSITFPSGTPSRIAAPSHARFGFGSGNFTIGGWLRQVAGASVQNLVDTRTASNTGIAVYMSGNRLAVASNIASLAQAPSDHGYDTWLHFEVCRYNNTLRGFIEGAQVLAVADTRTYASASQCFMGWDYGVNSNQFLSGWLDSVYVIKGVALRTTSQGFTPPSLPPRL